MAPDARGLVFLHLPGRVVDDSRAPSVLDLEARRRAQVKRHHVIVGMAPNGAGNFDALVLAEIVSRSDVVDVTALQHKVHQALGRRDDAEGDRMMARVTVHEGQAYRAPPPPPPPLHK